MPSLNMNGPYPFTSKKIDEVVTCTSEGNYALGYTREENGGFIPMYVGRSDTDLNQELKNRLSTGYPEFMFSYASSSEAAFEEECRNYHDFESQLDNEIHPARPPDTDLECPYCDVFDQKS